MEPDWSVNFTQCCVESSRPSDGPNRASHCKQHAHLDSSEPQGETKERERVKVKLLLTS